ncbi:hypothetical protein LAZ67_4003323 [Cordylochernes scorpioides]|uniref:Transposase n=1 Tax=Cordylochernes scorpioides TaxID=51811 RepID=A0ABY6KDR5_9ARAC|nr:hypothetical protein LAZ67_4003323 [Cordylochernes scorpioides]
MEWKGKDESRTKKFRLCKSKNKVLITFFNIKGIVHYEFLEEETLDLLKLAFGNENVNKPTTFRWSSRFKNGMESVKDEKRVGRPILHRNPEKEETGISKSLVGSIIKEDLQLKKTPSKFVPKMLTIQQKENRVGVAKKCLIWWKKTLIGRKNKNWRRDMGLRV